VAEGAAGVESPAHWPAVLAASRQVLAEQSITHLTLQPEPLHHRVRWLAPGEQRGVRGRWLMAAAPLALSEPRLDELPDLLALLDVCALPIADLETRHLPAFLVCRDDARLIAAAGLEACGDALLFRSLAVAPAYRRRGLAGRLLEALEERARTMRREQVFLLTTSAQDFFASRGFRPLARSAVPAAIAETAQFSSLCPASATCMVKNLACAPQREASP
jgi:amino-acid N-acetyltransferase